MLKNNLYNHSAACTNNLVLKILQSETVLSISKCSTLTNAESRAYGEERWIRWAQWAEEMRK
jgi:hypothetical protein